MSIVFSGTREYQAISDVCRVGRRVGRQTDAKSDSCVFDCVTGTVKTQGGRLVAIENNDSCCPSCDSGGKCKEAPFPWWWIVAAGVVAFYVGRR